MALEYDKRDLDKFRAVAVTSIEDIKVGQTYYSNNGQTFTVLEVIDDAEHDRRVHNGKYGGREGSYWARTTEDSAMFVGWASLADRNVEQSYNPWLLFESKEMAELCAYFLKIEYTADADDGWGW